MERQKYSLLELSKMIGKAIDDSFSGKYWIVSEINEIRENTSGHCYLELVEKDQPADRIIARSRATIWASTWRMLRSYFETSTSQSLTQGMMILTEVSVEFHELYGLSLNITDIDPVYTMGDLERKRTETIKKLEQEGIINMNRELSFPLFPARIAVVSSPHAAGYEDFMHQITNNPKKYRFDIRLFPAIMQGDSTGRSIIKNLEAIFEQEDMYDVVVILRGGGSASDLYSFDSYEIAAHIAQLPIPVITGIGHERDRTIAGMVAHTDLKTPTAVAEFLIGKFHELDMRLGGLSVRLAGEVSYIIDQKRHFISTSIKDLPVIVQNNISQRGRHLRSKGSMLAMSATGFLKENRHQLKSAHSGFGFIVKNYLLSIRNTEVQFSTRMLPGSIKDHLRKKNGQLELLNKTMILVDPANILKKGYALIYKGGRIIKSISEINDNDILETKLQDGRIDSKVLRINAQGD
jgi:exodeoxyribonuclease VII large subunit